MGALIKLIDAVLFVFFLIVAVQVPLFNPQVLFPSDVFPSFAVDIFRWYCREFGDYLFVEKPAFFVGLMGLELLFQWPLAILNLCGIAGGKPWFNTACLMYGVSAFTSMVAILAELILSGRITGKLKLLYFPFVGFTIVAIARGLLPRSTRSKVIGGSRALGRKKRA